MGMVILVGTDQIDYLNHRFGWVMCHISDFKILGNLYARPYWKEPLKPRLMTMEKIDSEYDLNEDK